MERNLHPLGRISKTHGFHGTVLLVSDLPLDSDIEQLEEIFIVVDGLQVPFPVKEIELLSDTSAFVHLEFVDNQKEALELIGCEAFVSSVICKNKPETGWETWIGCTVHDSVYGKIGVVQKIDDYKGNIVMQVTDGNKETLISLYPELITRIDHEEKIIQIAAPEGYF